MGRDELRRALNEASEGPERDFTGTWAQGRKVRRRRQTAQGLGVVALAAAAVGVFTLGGGNLLGEDATIEPLPPAEQTLTTEEATGEPTDGAPEDTTEEATTEEVTDEPTEEATSEGESMGPELPGPNDPLPTTVAEYARTFVAAGVQGDARLLAQMGSDLPPQIAAEWDTVTWHWDSPVISGPDEDPVGVIFFGDESVKLTLVLDRTTAEAGGDNAVTVASQTEAALPELSLEEYTDELVRLWPQDREADGAQYATAEAIETVAHWPAGGTWERVDVNPKGEFLVAVTYVEASTDAELIVTVSRPLVEQRELYAISHIEYVEEREPRASHPCDVPWSQVSPAGTGDAPEGVALASLDLVDLAAACNLEGLTDWAEQDSTTLLSQGGPAPADAFAGEEGRERALVIAQLLSTYEPALEAGDEGQTVATWPALPVDRLDELVDLGLYTQAEVDAMRDNGAYTGWQITLGEDGTWLSMVEGD